MRGVQVTDDGDVVLSQGAINGFLGGSVAPHPPQPAAHRTRLPASVVPAAPSLHPPRRHATPPHRAPLRTHRCIHSIPTQHPLLDPSSTPSSTPPRQVGAVGTLIATFVKRDQVKDRLKCPYCEGTGLIQCASPPLPLA
jgi:hypothetical protein